MYVSEPDLYKSYMSDIAPICRVYKNKQATYSDNTDSFDEDLFASPGDVQAETKRNLSTVEPTGSTEKLEARRSERFNFTKTSIIKHPAFVFAYARLYPEKADNSNLLHGQIPIRRLKRMQGPKRALLVKMITIAATRAELLEFIDIFKTYRQVGWFIDDLARLDFIGRCIHLKAPDIALAILYHRPAFGFDIPSLSSARALMRSLLSTPHPPPDADKAPLPEDMTLPTETPLAHALLLANLFDVYALPPAETDPVSRALLLGAGAEHLKAGTDTEEANAIIQLVRESAENQAVQPKGPVLNGKDPRVKDGKLVATSQALKERGKFTSQAAQLRTNPLYNDELTASERTWIERRLDKFVKWAQEQGQDTSWIDKLKVA
ncbi:unnamed protein product [Rhizoctonia solani]|uniref:Uncharacterized protein n=1 Tax=Rhizoctonia solani TaxID=456999 RepID=A0A8H3DQY4_9AGAM|nr:unnamed protein product [Rhizoctonia solani]CAE6540560.1 unnamed protein product [Rhizoctonia solani]